MECSMSEILACWQKEEKAAEEAELMQNNILRPRQQDK